MFFNIGSPRIRSALFDAEADTTLFGIDFQNFNFNFLRSGNDFARMYVFAGPAHFGNMDKAFNAVFQFNECAVIGDIGNFSFVDFANFVFVSNCLPRVIFQLFHAEADALGVFVEFDNLYFNRLTQRQNFCRVVDSLPGNIGNV